MSRGKKTDDKTYNMSKDTIFCSFCGRLRQEVNKLIEGPDGIFICDECIEMCHKIIQDEDIGDDIEKNGSKELLETTDLPSPEYKKSIR